MYESAFEHFAGIEGDDMTEINVEPDTLLRWILQVDDEGNEDAEVTVEHLTHLRQTRSLLPHPTWRRPTPDSLYLTGYAQGQAEAVARNPDLHRNR